MPYDRCHLHNGCGADEACQALCPAVRTGDVDSDRIALSQKLTVLADKFTIEAGHWVRGEQQAACIATARRLDALARQALGSADPDHVAGELDAADLLYRQVTGTRMFFNAYLPRCPHCGGSPSRHLADCPNGAANRENGSPDA